MAKNRLLLWSQMNKLLDHYDQQNKPIPMKSQRNIKKKTVLSENNSENTTAFGS